MTSQTFESFVPVYDAVPETWEEGRAFLVEHLKKITEGVNNREIGFYLDEELLSGKQFIPSPNSTTSDNFRSVFRIVVNTGVLVAGVNPPIPHGITITDRFTLIDLWVAGTDPTALTSSVITDDHVSLDATNINITSPVAYDRSFAIIEYLLEV